MTMTGIFGWLFPAKEEAAPVVEISVRIGLRGHEGEPLVITRLHRSEHVVDALFDDTRLGTALRRVELTNEAITLTFDASAPEEVRRIVRERLPDILGAPRFVVQE